MKPLRLITTSWDNNTYPSLASKIPSISLIAQLKTRFYLTCPICSSSCSGSFHVYYDGEMTEALDIASTTLSDLEVAIQV